MSDSGKITVNYFCLGAFFIFIGSVLLCALGFTVVLPFEVTRAWPSVQCTVINSTYDPTVCSCDEQLNVFDTCVSKYPCLKIHVFYVPPPGSVLPLSPWPNRTAAGGGIWSVTRRGGAERSRRSTDWIGEELNASHEFKVGNVFQTVLYNSRNVVSKNPVDVSSAVPFESIPVTTTDERFLDTVVKDLEEVEKVRGRSLLSSTLLPVGKSHPSKEGDVGLDRWTLAPPDVEQTEVGENWTDLLRMSKYEADDDDKGIETADERRGHGGGGGGGRVFATLYRSWDDSFNRQCSLTECGDETWNVKEARRFRDDWGRIGQTLPCFYNPLHPDMVIIERTSTVAAVHAVLWPGLCLIGGVTLWIGLCLGCWSLGSESTCKDDYGPIY